MSVRTERVASVIKEEVGTFVQRNFLLDEVGLMTITEVRVTPDLRQAKILVSVLGDKEKKEDALAQLEEKKPVIRSVVGQAVRLRYTPELLFVLDTTMDNAVNLEKIFKKIHEEEENRTKPEGSDDPS